MKKYLLSVVTISLGLLFGMMGLMWTELTCAEQKVVNLASNGSFEKETAGKPDGWNWSVSGEAEAICAVDTSESKFGQNSLKIINATVDTGNVFARLSQPVKVKPKTTYTLSCWVKGVKVLGVYWTNWEGWSLAVPDGTYDWKRIQTTFTTKEDQTATTLGLNTANVTEALYLDGIQFEEGSESHDFVEEKDDLALKIKTNADNINNIFISSDPVVIRFEISGAPADLDMQLNYRIAGFFDEVIIQDTKQVSIGQDGRFMHTINWPGRGNGVFDIWAEVSFRERKIVKKEQDTFSVIPPKVESGLLPDSPFGITFGIPDLMAYSGIKWTRLDAYWDAIEPEKGRFNFSNMDNHLKEANKYGIELLPIIDYSASWASSAPPGVPVPERCMYPPKDINDWKDYVRALVSHYKGKIKAWEIWNEANAFDTFFKTGSVEKYVELLKAAYPIIKDIDPMAKVIGCATTGIDTDFIEAVFKAGGFEYMDAVSVHPYRGTRGPEESNLEEDLLKLKGLIERYGGGNGLWNTEFGWWANDFQPEYSEKGLALTEREQANYLVRAYIISLSSGFEKVFWFTHRHPAEDFAQSMDAGIGLLYHDYKMKPAAVAYRTMTDELEGVVPVSKQKIGDVIEAHLFKKKDKNILAIWSWKEAEVIAVRSTGDIIIVDLMNNRKKIPGSKGSVLISLENGSPVFLEGEDIKILGQVIRIGMKEDILIPGRPQSIEVSLHNLLSGELKGTMTQDSTGYISIKPSTLSFAVKEGESQTHKFQVDVPLKAKYGREKTPFRFNLPGRLEKSLKIDREFQIMPSYSINLEAFEGDITPWKTNDKDAHVVYNRIEKSTEFIKEGRHALHWRCKSPGRWNTITRDISSIDLKGARQVSFWLYVPHAQKGGEQGMGIEILEKDGSKYYHSKPMIPLYPVGKWNLIILNLEDFYLPSFSQDENDRLDPEEIQFFTFNLTGGEFDVYIDGLKVYKSVE